MESRPGDLVLIHHRGEPMVYARIEEITADVKPGWWEVRLILLQVPSKEVTWILRDEYIDGGEFTMGGEPVILKPVPPSAPPPAPSPGPAREEEDSQSEPAASGGGKGDKVVSLSQRRRKGGNGRGRK